MKMALKNKLPRNLQMLQRVLVNSCNLPDLKSCDWMIRQLLDDGYISLKKSLSFTTLNSQRPLSDRLPIEFHLFPSPASLMEKKQNGPGMASRMIPTEATDYVRHHHHHYHHPHHRRDQQSESEESEDDDVADSSILSALESLTNEDDASAVTNDDSLFDEEDEVLF